MAPIVEASRAMAVPAYPARDAAPVPVPAPAPAPVVASVTPRRDATQVDRGRDDDGDERLAARGRYLLAELVPRASAHSQRQVSRVLALAQGANDRADERGVQIAAASVAAAPRIAEAGDIDRSQARRLHDEAKQAFWSRRHLPEAFDYTLKAFAADPHDAAIAGKLAFLHLRLVPAQPERARQLALHAIALRTPRDAAGRVDDWTTLAIASALTGRAADARNALLAAVALGSNVDRSCRTALAALSTYGESMREPVEAVLQRFHAQGRGDDSPYCAWPPGRIASSGSATFR